MFFTRKPKPVDEKAALAQALYNTVDRTQAMIRFSLDGIILDANDLFLSAMGYQRSEIVGKHHRIFMPPEEVNSSDYQQFWAGLAAGKSFSTQFRRVAKGGRDIWIQAVYAPVLDDEGRPLSVIKVATDITARQTGIQRIAMGLERLSEGDLSQRVPDCAAPDIDELGRTYNQAMEKLSEAMQNVTVASTAVERTARGLERSSNDLSHRTVAQAATLEQTSAALHQLAEAVTQSSDNARDVVKTADQAMNTAREGGKVADDAVNAMSKISRSSGRISQVISVIDDIAFQTNLLALNAGVEAARAGESGRGFAVVASEVRQLAIRSAEAAAEIAVLTIDSRKQVDSGVHLVTQAGDELKRIIDGIDEINRKIREIATGARDQAGTLSEITASMSDLDVTTQKNAAMVEDSSQASRLLMEQAGKLERQVSQFNVGPRTQAHPQARVA